MREGLVVGSKVGDECPPYSNNGGFSAFSYDGVKSSVVSGLGMGVRQRWKGERFKGRGRGRREDAKMLAHGI